MNRCNFVLLLDLFLTSLLFSRVKEFSHDFKLQLIEAISTESVVNRIDKPLHSCVDSQLVSSSNSFLNIENPPEI